MKAIVKIEYLSTFTIELTDYGIDENVRFEDLSENEQFDISDPLLDEIVPQITIKTID